MSVHANVDRLTELFVFVVRATGQATLLAGLVLLIQWALRGRLNARFPVSRPERHDTGKPE